MYTYRVYNNLFRIFLIQMECRLQNMYNQMVWQGGLRQLYIPSIPYSLEFP